MSTAIKPKKASSGQIFNEHAKRYMFYPLYNLDFAASQSTSPVYCPKFPKAEIVLLESFNYWAADDEYDESVTGGNGLISRVMGTDAQVKFLMGNTESGYMASGMSHLQSITDYDPQTVAEISELIFPNGEKPSTVGELRNYLIQKNGELVGELAPIAKKVLAEILDGVERSIRWCQATILEMEGEINDSKTGKKLAMKSGLTEKDKYLYNQIGRPLPEDKSGINMAQELGKILAGAISGNVPASPEKELEDRMAKQELEALRREVAEKDKLIQELAGYETESAE